MGDVYPIFFTRAQYIIHRTGGVQRTTDPHMQNFACFGRKTKKNPKRKDGNRYSGKLKARILFGSTAPPAKKLHAPTYSNQNLQLLQEKFDMLEAEGVLGRPEDHGVTVEHVSASFLVRKNSGGFRLVTAFTALSSLAATPKPSQP